MKIARREHDVDAGPPGALECERSGVEILLRRPRHRRDHRPAHRGRDRADAGELALGRHREAGLDHVHAQPLEPSRDRDLLVGGERETDRLLAVAKRRVEHGDPAGFHQLSSNARRPCEGGPLA